MNADRDVDGPASLSRLARRSSDRVSNVLLFIILLYYQGRTGSIKHPTPSVDAGSVPIRPSLGAIWKPAQILHSDSDLMRFLRAAWPRYRSSAVISKAPSVSSATAW